MDKKSQAKNALVDLINVKLDKLGWKQKDLEKASGVSQSIISRFLGDHKQRGKTKGISAKNISSILETLELLKDGSAPVAEKNEQFDVLNIKYLELLEDYKNLSDCLIERDNYINRFKNKGECRRECDEVELTPLKKNFVVDLNDYKNNKLFIYRAPAQ